MLPWVLIGLVDHKTLLTFCLCWFSLALIFGPLILVKLYGFVIVLVTWVLTCWMYSCFSTRCFVTVTCFSAYLFVPSGMFSSVHVYTLYPHSDPRWFTISLHRCTGSTLRHQWKDTLCSCGSNPAMYYRPEKNLYRLTLWPKPSHVLTLEVKAGTKCWKTSSLAAGLTRTVTWMLTFLGSRLVKWNLCLTICPSLYPCRPHFIFTKRAAWQRAVFGKDIFNRQPDLWPDIVLVY